jgi:hypothetical protein
LRRYIGFPIQRFNGLTNRRGEAMSITYLVAIREAQSKVLRDD